MVLQLTIGSGCRSDTLNLFSVNATGAWLVRQQYLRVNPFGGLPAAPAVQLGITGRTLTRAQWQYVLQTALRRHSAFKPAFHPRVLGSRTRDERGRARRGDHRHAHMHRARRRTGRRVELAGDGEGPARAPYRCRGTGSTRCASSCARARCRSARHPADCASRDRRGAAPGRGRATVQGDLCEGRRVAGDHQPERGRGSAARERTGRATPLRITVWTPAPTSATWRNCSATRVWVQPRSRPRGTRCASSSGSRRLSTRRSTVPVLHQRRLCRQQPRRVPRRARRKMSSRS